MLRRVFIAIALAAGTAASTAFVLDSPHAWGEERAPNDSPAAATSDSFTPAQRGHWAFQPVTRPVVPAIPPGDANDASIRTPIDAFLRDKLLTAGRGYSPEADRATLLRRLSFDLLGLPPTTDHLNDFLADESPEAYERLVDRLLASPHYGEARGRMWLDVVRFSDSAGYNADPVRPLAWKYRDWVVDAFNSDLRYDRFLAEQLAGDELFPDDPSARIAAGYLRMWPDESNASNILLARQDALNDLTGNLGAAVLGLSLGCAQCHDHKFDPLPQRDFYAVQATFAGLTPVDRAPVGSPAALAEYRARWRAWLEETEPVRRELQELETSARLPLTAERRMKFPAVVLEAIDTHPDRRTTMQRQLAFWSERQVDYKEADLVKKLSDEQKTRRDELKKRLDALEKSAPKPPHEVAALTIAESDDIPPTAVLSSGSYDRPEAPVKPGTLSILAPPGASTDLPRAESLSGSSGRRAALVRWLTDRRHPLVARVFVNRIWQEHFGVGLVENANDFGTQSSPPSHPELMDWLASELIGAPAAGSSAEPATEPAGAWSRLKRIEKLIVTSAAYRQRSQRSETSTASTTSTSTDDRFLYDHFPRRRLSAERVRDGLLAVAGQLTTSMGGPGVSPPLPAGYNTREAWKVSENRRDHNRRSIYILAKRNLPFPILHAFDLPDMHESCACRSKTTTAPQALMLVNSEFSATTSRALADSILQTHGPNDRPAWVRAAWRRVLNREPETDEATAALAFLGRQVALAAADSDTVVASHRRKSGADAKPGAAANAPASKAPASNAPASDVAALNVTAVAETGLETLEAALSDLCHALLNTNEFLYVD